MMPELVEPAGLVLDRNDDGTAAALFSADRTYRYALTRRWADGPVATFVMLNPSTADAMTVDPTVRRCIGFARTWGAAGLLVLNIFALRSTDPHGLYAHADPVGPHNDRLLAELNPATCSHVVCAWGAHGALHGQGARALALLAAAGHTTTALRITKAGMPGHPLYLPASAVPQPYADTATTRSATVCAQRVATGG